MENVLKGDLRTDRSKECIFIVSGCRNFIFLLNTNLWSLCGFNASTGLPKKISGYVTEILTFASNSVFKHVQSLLGNSGFVSVILLNLSKVYDSLSHHLLVANLEAHSFQKGKFIILSNWSKTMYHIRLS